MKAVILAGGKGGRMRAFANSTPKALLKIGGIPILEIIIRQLGREGFDEVVLALGHMKEKIQAHFDGWEGQGVRIIFSNEDTPLGTAAPLKMIEDLPENFLVMNGDILTDLSFAEFLRAHEIGRSDCTIASITRSLRLEFGILETENENRVLHYAEKPEYTLPTSMGVYALCREAVELIPSGRALDFPELVNRLIKADKKVACVSFEGLWFDLGNMERRKKAERAFLENRKRFMG
jgi:NDP-sugar pyrophosphorylase family protein